MSRLCRLKTYSHGADGKWAYDEITKLRAEIERLQAEITGYAMQESRQLDEAYEQLAAKDQQISLLREALKEAMYSNSTDVAKQKSEAALVATEGEKNHDT